MPPLKNTDPPQISFTSWILGGPLISAGNHGLRVSSISSPAAAHIEIEAKRKKKKSKPISDGGDAAVLEGLEGLEIVIADDAPAVALGKLTGMTAGIEKDREREASKDRDREGGREKDRNSAKNGGESSTWTAKQDEMILAMKAGSKSWTDIAAAVGASKKNVQNRFKELQSQTQSKCASKSREETADGKKGEEDARDGKNEKKEKNNVKDENKEKTERKEGPKNDDPESRGRLKADEVWTREDCEVLEMLESRYTDQKWLQIQAGFYNMTGRMVIADIIRKKFSEGETS